MCVYSRKEVGDPKKIEDIPERDLHREEKMERVLCLGIIK